MLIELKEVSKVYKTSSIEVQALRQVSLEVAQGEFVAIMGPSGSGKSTLMNLMGCLDRPTSGSYRLDGIDVSKLNDVELARVRNQKIGFVFQNFNLLGRQTALENVMLPTIYAGLPPRERRARALAALEMLGLGDRIRHRPSELSGGERQRVAIARALVNDPVLILADEPTGALDTKTSEEIMAIFEELNRSGRTIVMVTHEPDVAKHAARQIRLRDGAVESDERPRPQGLEGEGTAV